MHFQPNGSSHKPTSVPPPLAITGPAKSHPTDSILAPSEAAFSPLPSEAEVLRYRELRRAHVGSKSPQDFASLVQSSLNFRDRLKGEGAVSGNGGIKIAELRLEWASQAERALSDLHRIIPDLYRAAPSAVIATIVSDLLKRLSAKGVRLSKAHIQSTMSECLEQTRLMVIFAGRALKSSEHIQSALSGLKGKSFAEGASERSPKGEPLDASTRQSNFEQRQKEKLAAAEARKAALRAGGPAAAKDVKPKPPKDEFKSELLTQTAADYAKLCREAQPSEEQKESLAQRPARELEARLSSRLTKPKGPPRDEELESLRVEITNEVARLIRSWMDNELSLAGSLGQEMLMSTTLPQDAVRAAARKATLSAARASATALLTEIETELVSLAQVNQSSGNVLAALLDQEQARQLALILNPPREKETYDLA
jgi:hypothetical protein